MNEPPLDRKYIFGRRPVEELLHGTLPVEKVFIQTSVKGPFEIFVRSICKSKDIPLVRVQGEYLNRISKSTAHQGIAAISSAIPFQDLEDLIPFLYENNQIPSLAILDHVTDVRNFGSVARSAEVLGIHGLIIPKKGSAAITEEAIKASAGALFTIPVCRVSNIQNIMHHLKNSGILIAAADQNAELTVSNMDFSGPLAILLGAEGRGVQKELLQLSDSQFRIPQSGTIASLNVSVAAGIIFHEIQKFRQVQ